MWVSTKLKFQIECLVVPIPAGYFLQFTSVRSLFAVCTHMIKKKIEKRENAPPDLVDGSSIF